MVKSDIANGSYMRMKLRLHCLGGEGISICKEGKKVVQLSIIQTRKF